MGEGLTMSLSMKYARHAPGSYKVRRLMRAVLEQLHEPPGATTCDFPECGVRARRNPRKLLFLNHHEPLRTPAQNLP